MTHQNPNSNFRYQYGIIDGEIDTCELAIENHSDEDLEDAAKADVDIRKELRGWRMLQKLMELADEIPMDKIINSDKMVLLKTNKA